jgi:hypothetical protein
MSAAPAISIVLFEGGNGECLREAQFKIQGANSHSLGEGKPFAASYSSKPTFTHCFAFRRAS